MSKIFLWILNDEFSCFLTFFAQRQHSARWAENREEKAGERWETSWCFAPVQQQGGK